MSVHGAGVPAGCTVTDSSPQLLAEPLGIRSRRVQRREPAGVVGAITPWNFPVQIMLAKAGPALAAGCTVVLKPAPDTPWSATMLGRIAAEDTDLPPGVLNVVAGSRHEIGHLLAEMQLRVVWEDMLARFPVIEVTGEPTRLNSNFVKGYSRLPVRIPG